MNTTIKTTNNIQAYTFAFIAEKINNGTSDMSEIRNALYNDILPICGKEITARTIAKIAVQNFQEVAKAQKTITISGIEYELTEEKTHRIREAIAETKRQIDQEMTYSPEFRKNKEIARWQAHIEKLEGYLK